MFTVTAARAGDLCQVQVFTGRDRQEICGCQATVLVEGTPYCASHAAEAGVTITQEELLALEKPAAPAVETVVGQTRLALDWPPSGKMSAEENPYFVK